MTWSAATLGDYVRPLVGNTRIDLRVTEVPALGSGNRLEIEGDAFLIQGGPLRDRDREWLVWIVDLRPAWSSSSTSIRTLWP